MKASIYIALYRKKHGVQECERRVSSCEVVPVFVSGQETSGHFGLCGACVETMALFQAFASVRSARRGQISVLFDLRLGHVPTGNCHAVP